jgi:hypothetical protein
MSDLAVPANAEKARTRARGARAARRAGAEEELHGVIATLDVTPTQRHYLVTRFAGQLAWMEGKAQSAQRRYVWTRLTTLIGALIIPVLIGLTPSDADLSAAIRIATGVIGLVVAISAAVEQFFHYGARWQHYRRTVERLKTEGWRYFELIDDYRTTKPTGHNDRFPRFARRVEDLLQEEADVYLREVVAERREDRQEPSPEQISP